MRSEATLLDKATDSSCDSR